MASSWLNLKMSGLLSGASISAKDSSVFQDFIASDISRLALPTPPPASLYIYNGAAIKLGDLILPLDCPPAFMLFQPLVWGSWFAAGSLAGPIAYRLARQGSSILAATFGGFSFLVAGFIGSQAVDTLPNPDLFPILFLSGTGIPFAIVSFGVALTFALAVGLARWAARWDR